MFSGFCQILSRLEGFLTDVSGKVGKGEKVKGQNYDRENVLEGKIQERLKVSNRDYYIVKYELFVSASKLYIILTCILPPYNLFYSLHTLTHIHIHTRLIHT